jgi:hypothetical protein
LAHPNRLSLSTHSELESARPSGKSFILSLTSFVLLHRLACERKQPTFFQLHLRCAVVLGCSPFNPVYSRFALPHLQFTTTLPEQKIT